MIRRYLLLALALSYCGCATSRSAESEAKGSLALQKDATAQRNETRTVTQGPETITTTVEEWEPGPSSPVGSDPRAAFEARSTNSAVSPGGQVPAALPPSASPASAPTLAYPPILVKRTTVVDVRGPVVTESALQAQRATETHATAQVEAQSQEKHSFRPAGLFALWPYLLAAGVAALAYWRKDLLLGMVKKVLP